MRRFAQGSTARNRSEVTALGHDQRFDLKKAVWLLAGIAGASPAFARCRGLLRLLVLSQNRIFHLFGRRFRLRCGPGGGHGGRGCVGAEFGGRHRCEVPGSPRDAPSAWDLPLGFCGKSSSQSKLPSRGKMILGNSPLVGLDWGGVPFRN